MASTSDSGIGSAAPTAASAASRAAALLAAPLLLAAASPLPASLEIEVAGLRSAKGQLRLCLTGDPGNFPDCRTAAGAITRSVPANSGTIRIEGLAPGTYALALIHDENGNARLDTFAGIPREGFGFSRNPRIGFGPPRFRSASFALGEGPAMQQVRIRYLL